MQELPITKNEAAEVPARGALSRGVSTFLRPVNALFDWLYHSEYNPFYRSGTLAIGLLFVLLGTGFYLLLFYSVSTPYESVQAIESQRWLGQWVRALHRYATDAILIAVLFHVLQLLSHGKTWGPRTLAWISGVLLLGALALSTMTGYVMVWDDHGQLIALSGLKLLSALPVLSNEVSLSFSGRTPLPSSFFFMNLFLHIAIPLGMVILTWIHTARLARTVWFPIRPVFYGALFGLFLLSIIFPAPLGEKADLLGIPGSVSLDLWYNFWIPLQQIGVSDLAILLGFVFFTGIALTIPAWWKPPSSRKPPISEVDIDGCTGCTQCARDCPFEAIQMVPHPSGKHLLAEVAASHCVSCGVCSASCDVMAIGPKDRTGIEQMIATKELIRGICEDTAQSPTAPARLAVLACLHNDDTPSHLRRFASEQKGVYPFHLNCCATLHTDVLELLLQHVSGIMISGCAARNCMNRDGLELLKGRLYQKRVPFLSKNIDRNRIRVAPHSESEFDELQEEILNFQSALSRSETFSPSKTLAEKLVWGIKRTVATTILLLLIALLSDFPYEDPQNKGYLRVVGRLPGSLESNCHVPNEAEQSGLPFHMRKQEICEKSVQRYLLKVTADDQVLHEELLTPKGERLDRAILVNRLLPLGVGSKQVKIDLLEHGSQKVLYSSEEEVLANKGKILLRELNTLGE